MEQEPTIGRIVHYVLDDVMDTHRPAIVVECSGRGIVGLQVFIVGLASHGTQWKSSVSQDEDYKSKGTWHWPEREA